MPRKTDEWMGKDDGTDIPVRVKLRIFDKCNGTCQKCRSRVYPGRFQYDHITAIINGGGNRESNLWILCDSCHGGKTREDVGIKSRTARIRANHLGLKKPKGRPMPGSRASGWKKRLDGTVVKR